MREMFNELGILQILLRWKFCHIKLSIRIYDINPGATSHQCLLIDGYTELSDINALLAASDNYMLERQEATEIIEEVRAAIKDWQQVATRLQISSRLLDAYSGRWDNL